MAAQLVFTAEQRQVYKDQFAGRDMNGDNSITPEEMDKVMKSMGKEMSKKQIVQIFADADANRDGTLDFYELLMNAAAIFHKRSSKTKQYIRAFMDLDKDNNGFLSVDELRQGLLNVDPPMTEEAITAMIKKTDHDENGRVDYNEFVTMITTAE